MTDARAAIDNLLQRYFDALYFSDSDLMGQIFHPRAIYATADEDPPLYRSMNEYIHVVASRQSPASRGEPRRDFIDSVELAGGQYSACAGALLNRGSVLRRFPLTGARQWRVADHRQDISDTSIK